MWFGVPKRALLLGSAVLLGRLVWWRMLRQERHAQTARVADFEDTFPDTVPAVWSGFQEQAQVGNDARM